MANVARAALLHVCCRDERAFPAHPTKQRLKLTIALVGSTGTHQPKVFGQVEASDLYAPHHLFIIDVASTFDHSDHASDARGVLCERRPGLRLGFVLAPLG